MNRTTWENGGCGHISGPQGAVYEVGEAVGNFPTSEGTLDPRSYAGMYRLGLRYIVSIEDTRTTGSRTDFQAWGEAVDPNTYGTGKRGALEL